MADDEVSGLRAASGVVAINIDSLHAQRTGGLLVEDGDNHSVINRGAKSSRLDNSVVAVVAGGEGGDESSSVWLSEALKALCLAKLSRGFHLQHQLSVNCLVELKRGH